MILAFLERKSENGQRRVIGRTWLVMLVFSAALFFVGCTGEQTQSGKQQQSGNQEEPSSEADSKPTPEPSAAQGSSSEAPLKSQARQANETDEEASSTPPEEVLGLQYEYINRGDYESAYSLFDGYSQREVSPRQYQAFFEANAPYSVTNYSFSASLVQGDTATVDATFTANSASGAEQLQRTQEFVRENGEWRVVMRPEQIAAFTATEEKADQEQEDSPTAEEELRRRLAENRATMEEDMAKRREAQAADMKARQEQAEALQDQRDAKAAERRAAYEAETAAQKKQRDAETAAQKKQRDAEAAQRQAEREKSKAPPPGKAQP